MKIDRIQNIRPELADDIVTVKLTGNITEIRYMSSYCGGTTRKTSKYSGINTLTNETVEFEHNSNRAQDKASVAQSLKRLRDLINTNLTDPETALWVTLTYAKNMTDTEQLYEDFRRFWLRFKYYLKVNGLPKAEYIAAAEPQARGAWHLHCLFLFQCKAPFIPNAEMERLWKNEPKDKEKGKGFTKTKGLKGNDNPGLYLTAYLGDMEINTDAAGNADEHASPDCQSKQKKKSIIKGARMNLYPTGFNLYRHSQGVKYPTIIKGITEAEAQIMVGSVEPDYEKTIGFIDENGEVVNFINYRQYNKAKRSTQKDENCSN